MHTDPIATGLLEVGDGHRVYWEDSGALDGVPLVYLHGGPGGGLNKGSYRGWFDNDRFRVIGLDQRGCGRSTPHASDPTYDLGANTTAHLIADLEALRTHLGIERWVVTGVSSGSTLGLAYGRAHPERTLAVSVMAVTTTGRAEVDWITEHVGRIFPEAWDEYAGYAERAGVGYRRGQGRLVTAYAGLLADPDPLVHRPAAEAWMRWEDAHVGLLQPTTSHSERPIDYQVAFTRLTAHYWSHDGFVDPPLLTDPGALREIPVGLVHGRRDISGPAVTAYALHRVLPRSRLVIESTEGHGGPLMVAAWRQLTCDLGLG
ncbi:alpha/beta fold hydrolase [Allobranchiibius huperziae]|uniref:Proline iminopeptidase n=1 Tax=Allobranchiibius huperziae TaxID=1874116 RepID=A0A853DD02_9MICO|nr:alpha/beta fold hydrolase [Allobranchiibius huperziae]NYJ75252.1 proline iminopeptidase [Allobranchiibius huperziae]